MPTDKKFTGQRLDGTGLYYYGGRYYDPQIGRFISADTIIPDWKNPRDFNRYSYVLNNPLKYSDPTGHRWWIDDYIPLDLGPEPSLPPSSIPPSPTPQPPDPTPKTPSPAPPPTIGDDEDDWWGDDDGSETEPSLPIERHDRTNEGNNDDEDIAALAFETLHTFHPFAAGFAMSGVVFGAGTSIIGIGIVTSEVGVGIGLAVAGSMLVGAGLAGMGATTYAAIETWNRLEYGERWERALGW